MMQSLLNSSNKKPSNGLPDQRRLDGSPLRTATDPPLRSLLVREPCKLPKQRAVRRAKPFFASVSPACQEASRLIYGGGLLLALWQVSLLF